MPTHRVVHCIWLHSNTVNRGTKSQYDRYTFTASSKANYLFCSPVDLLLFSFPLICKISQWYLVKFPQYYFVRIHIFWCEFTKIKNIYLVPSFYYNYFTYKSYELQSVSFSKSSFEITIYFTYDVTCLEVDINEFYWSQGNYIWKY